MDARSRAIIGRLGWSFLALLALPSALRLVQWAAYGAMAMVLGEIPTGGWIFALGEPFIYSGWVDGVCKWLCQDAVLLLGQRFDSVLDNEALQGAAAFVSAGILSWVQWLGILFAHRAIGQWEEPSPIDAAQSCAQEARLLEKSIRNPGTVKKDSRL